MTLEKLLIFGFALAVCIALTAIAASLADDRSPQAKGYKSKVTTMVKRTR